MVREPHKQAALMLAGATATFTPTRVLAAAIAARASMKISPRVEGVQPLGPRLEVAELRMHDASPLAHQTLAQAEIRSKFGANIVGQWIDDRLRSAPAPDVPLQPGTILIAAGSPDSIRALRELARPITHEGRLVVVGHGHVGKPLARLLRDAGDEVCVIDRVDGDGVDVVGDVLEPEVLEAAAVADARAVVLNLGHDSTTQFVAKVLRQFAPDLPILAGVMLSDNVGRIQTAGVDFAISLSEVAGQLLARHVLDETVSLQPRIKLVKTRPGPLAGKHPHHARIRERTDCSVVAVERDGELLMDYPPEFRLSSGDALFICGTTRAVSRFDEEFPASRL
jgi:Trk K+ transport system NAD-binding subunit